MAGYVNEVTLIGNLGKDPEVRSTQGGHKVANLSIATSETWKDKDTGEKKEKTQWHRVVVWGDGLVGVLEKYTKKGNKIYIRGQLEHRKWKDKDEKDQYTTEVVVQGLKGSVVLLGSNDGYGRRDDPGPSDADAPPPNTQKPQGGEQKDFLRKEEDEIPF